MQFAGGPTQAWPRAHQFGSPVQVVTPMQHSPSYMTVTPMNSPPYMTARPQRSCTPPPARHLRHQPQQLSFIPPPRQDSAYAVGVAPDAVQRRVVRPSMVVRQQSFVPVGGGERVQAPVVASHSFVPLARPSGAAQPSAAVSRPEVFNDNILPWLQAARDFEMNQDFDVGATTARSGRLDLPSLMNIMKQESNGKRTIQALADKLTLHRMLDNMSVPQLPALLAVQRHISDEQVAQFVDTHLWEDGAQDVVLKPTHLSNGQGVLVLSKVQPQERHITISFLSNHIRQYMAQHAGAHESLALQSLIPGFLVQPRYRCVVPFKAPMELRVISLWGKVRMGLWWWGRTAGAPGEAPQRNAWLVRKPMRRNQLSDDDDWQVIHEHEGENPGFETALALFRRHMPAMAATTEAIATAFGAPFLRCDFFVGSAEWGVRLNEVAYGCGVDYRAPPAAGNRKLQDDAPNLARILQEGMMLCQKVRPADHFLTNVGATGRSYQELVVQPCLRSLAPLAPCLPSSALCNERDDFAAQCAVPEDLCETRRRMDENNPPGYTAAPMPACKVQFVWTSAKSFYVNPSYAPPSALAPSVFQGAVLQYPDPSMMCR